MSRVEFMKLSWVMNHQGKHFSMEEANLLPEFMAGVYVIFCNPDLPNGAKTTVACYVGQSRDRIKGRIKTHIKEKNYGLGHYFTFAKLEEPDLRDGVERFLYDCYDPLDTKKAPNVEPISVNLPFVEYLQGGRFWVIHEALKHHHTQVLEEAYGYPCSYHSIM